MIISADNNAVSGAKIELQSLVPILSSDDGNVIYGNQYSSSLGAWTCFNGNGNGNTSWNSTSRNGNYVGYNFQEKVCVKVIIVQGRNTNTWKAQGSNDGTNWIDLSDPIQVRENTTGIFELSSDDKYTKYRLYRTEDSGVNTGLFKVYMIGYK